MVERIGNSQGVTLRPVTLADAEFIVSLRTDPRLSKFLSGVPGSVEAQRDWLEDYTARERQGQEYYFLIQFQGRPCGTVRLYDFQGDSFCWGSWILVPGLPAYVSLLSFFLALDHAFRTLGFARSHFDVRKKNRGPRNFYLRIGAKVVREDELNLYLNLTRADYERARRRYRKVLHAGAPEAPACGGSQGGR